MIWGDAEWGGKKDPRQKSWPRRQVTKMELVRYLISMLASEFEDLTKFSQTLTEHTRSQENWSNTQKAADLRITIWNIKGILNNKRELELFLNTQHISLPPKHTWLVNLHRGYRLENYHTTHPDHEAKDARAVTITEAIWKTYNSGNQFHKKYWRLERCSHRQS